MTEELKGKLATLLIQDEGKKLKPYQDTVGKWTVGIGHNLSDKGISEEACLLILDNDISEVEQQFENNFPSWEQLSDSRKLVILSMIFNLGLTKFLGFKRVIDAVNRNDFATASLEMLDSTWAKQVGKRAERLAKMMREG